MPPRDTPQVARAFTDIMRIPGTIRTHIDVAETMRHYRLDTDEAVALRRRLSAARTEMGRTSGYNASEKDDVLTIAMRVANTYARDIRMRATGPAPTSPNPYTPRASSPTASRTSPT